MTLLNHIGLFIILILLFFITSIIEEKKISIENLWISIKASLLIILFFELFYWVIKIFF